MTTLIFHGTLPPPPPAPPRLTVHITRSPALSRPSLPRPLIFSPQTLSTGGVPSRGVQTSTGPASARLLLPRRLLIDARRRAEGRRAAAVYSRVIRERAGRVLESFASLIESR